MEKLIWASLLCNVGSHAGTPLHHAAKKGLEQTVNLLLAYGGTVYLSLLQKVNKKMDSFLVIKFCISLSLAFLDVYFCENYTQHFSSFAKCVFYRTVKMEKIILFPVLKNLPLLPVTLSIPF